MDGDKSITATFIPIQYNLNIIISGNGTVTKNPDQATYTSGSSVVLQANPAAGYQFSGWSGSATGTTNPLTVLMNSNKNITATFVPLVGVASFNLINASTDKVIQQLTNGAVLNLATLPTKNLNIQVVTNPGTVGSVRSNLSGRQTQNRTDSSFPYSVFSGSGNNYSSWTPSTGNYNLTAQSFSGSNANGTPGTSLTISFSVINQVQYSLNVSIAGSGIVAKNPDQTLYNSGTNVTLQATPSPGYQFTGWSGSASGTTNPLTVLMNANKNITATFIPVYSINFTINGSGTVTKTPNQATYLSGSNVSLQANPASGFQFAGWSGDVSGTTNPITVNMNADKNITVNFTAIAPQQYTLSVLINGSGNVTKSPDQSTYLSGSIVNLEAIPDAGYQFNNWSGDASGTTNPLPVNMSSNKIITANFSLIGSPPSYCGPGNSDNIGCFTSVQPTGQTQVMRYPTGSHAFQMLAKNGTTPYTDGTAGTLMDDFDFTGYVQANLSNRAGHLSLNHESVPGGVSMMDLHFDDATNLWAIDAVKKVDFSQVVKSQHNCSGGITPWGTVISSEEEKPSGDANADGYQDIGWQVEIDPVTGTVRDFTGDGIPDKLWALGRMAHENITFRPDNITIYEGEDGGTQCVYKFVANQPANLSAGTLYVLKRDNATSTTGTWIVVPNTTQSQRNNVSSAAGSLGGTNWNGVEDIEFGPDSKVYFSSKGTGTIWRFKDDGNTISELEAWVTPQFYPINYGSGVQSEDWGLGIDNLAFDGDGNLWALQGGGRLNLWVVRPDHTPANPKIELFMTTPTGSEPTGLTFSPDFRYGFMSFQHPTSSNTQTIIDAAGNVVRFNADMAIVFARKEFLGQPAAPRLAQSNAQPLIEVYPNPFENATTITVELPAEAEVKLEVYDMYRNSSQSKVLFDGKMNAGKHAFEFSPKNVTGLQSGIYLVRLKVNDKQTVTKVLQIRK